MAAIINLLAAAVKQLVLTFITERLLKDIVVVALEKLSKSTKTKVDDEVLHIVKRALYPDYEVGQPPELAESKAPEENSKTKDN